MDDDVMPGLGHEDRAWISNAEVRRLRECETEIRGAKAVIAALVKKYGPCDLSVSEIVAADHTELIIVSGVDGFSYRTRSQMPCDSQEKNR